MTDGERELKARVDGLGNLLTIQMAVTQKVLAYVLALTEAVEEMPDFTPGGEPPGEFLARRTRRHMDDLMRQGEDLSPTIAARMQAVLDRIGNPGPGDESAG